MKTEQKRRKILFLCCAASLTLLVTIFFFCFCWNFDASSHIFLLLFFLYISIWDTMCFRLQTYMLWCGCSEELLTIWKDRRISLFDNNLFSILQEKNITKCVKYLWNFLFFLRTNSLFFSLLFDDIVYQLTN